jgi:hypothetical protein
VATSMATVVAVAVIGAVLAVLDGWFQDSPPPGGSETYPHQLLRTL